MLPSVTAVCSLTLVKVTVLFFLTELMKFHRPGQKYVKNQAAGAVLLVQKWRTVHVLSDLLPLDGTPGKSRRCHLEQRLA